MSKLFEPIEIGGLKLKNRMMFASMENGYAEPGGIVTERLIRYFEERAGKGVAAVMTGSMAVDFDGKGVLTQLEIHDPQRLGGIRRMVERVHGHGCAIGAQLYHAGRQMVSDQGIRPIAPSAVQCGLLAGTLPKEMDAADMARLRESFRIAAERTVDCGFDLIELHLAHGYLLHSFLSPYSNRRADEYGGSLENRMRFPLEILEIVRRASAGRIPTIVRLSVEEYLDGGLPFSEGLEICKELERRGAAAISVSAGSYDSMEYMIQPMYIPQGVLAGCARRVREAVKIPVIVAGRLNSAALMRRLLDEGDADMLAVGRGLLADEELLEKLREGRDEEIRYCTACNQGCLDRIFVSSDVRCIFNPRVGFEAERRLEPAGSPLRIGIVGAGPAGMELARIAAQSGHRVVLFDREALGGGLNLMAMPKDRESFRLPVRWMEGAVRRGEVAFVREEITGCGQLEPYGFDRVFAAAGSVQALLPAGRIPVMGVRRAMTGEMPAGEIAVLGGGAVGLECARYFAERGARVHVFEKCGRVGAGVGDTFLPRTLRELEEWGVRLHCGYEVTDPDALAAEYPGIGAAVQSFGRRENRELLDRLRACRPIPVGSARRPMSIMECTSDAWDAFRAGTQAPPAGR